MRQKALTNDGWQNFGGQSVTLEQSSTRNFASDVCTICSLLQCHFSHLSHRQRTFTGMAEKLFFIVIATVAFGGIQIRNSYMHVFHHSATHRNMPQLPQRSAATQPFVEHNRSSDLSSSPLA